jgi:hypothetical protein
MKKIIAEPVQPVKKRENFSDLERLKGQNPRPGFGLEKRIHFS